MGPCQSTIKETHKNTQITTTTNQMQWESKSKAKNEKVKQVRPKHNNKRSDDDITREHNSHHNNSNHESCSSDNSLLNNKITFTIEPSIQPKDSTIFTKKGDAFSFSSIKGKWSILSECGMTSYEGYSNIKSQKCSIATLLFRIVGGATQKAEMGKVYIADSTGSIQFFPHIDDNDINMYQTNGSLEITMKGVKKLPQNRIDSEMGWVNMINSKCASMTKEENMVIDYINKIRSAPQLFSKLYLNEINNNNKDNEFKEIKEVLTEFTPISRLEVNEQLILTGQAHAKNIGENGITGHIGTDNSTLKQRLSKYAKGTRIVCFGENCYYGSDNPLSIILEMISDNKSIDKLNRMNILNPQFNSIGVSICKHYSFKWCCIIVFGEII